MIPPLPDPRTLSDSIREDAGRERLEPSAVEKDFHLSRLLWALGEALGDSLLLKGGTCLSKVDLGYHRMSEDADFALPWDRSLSSKGANARQTNRVRDALKGIAPAGLRLPQPDGESFHKRSHVIWTLEYSGDFPPTALVVEVSMRPVLRTPRRSPLRMLLRGPLAEPYSNAFTWALAEEEVRAEKVRAAFTREEKEPRDLYDLDLLRRTGRDLSSAGFVSLVDEKLAEIGAAPLRKQPPALGLDRDGIERLSRASEKRLRSVVRSDEPAFDVPAALAALDRLWKKKDRGVE